MTLVWSEFRVPPRVRGAVFFPVPMPYAVRGRLRQGRYTLCPGGNGEIPPTTVRSEFRLPPIAKGTQVGQIDQIDETDHTGPNLLS